MVKSASEPPLFLVGGAAPRLPAAAPLVAEEDLRAVVVERRRVPERHVRVRHGVDADRMLRIVDVQQETEARARAAGGTNLRIDRHDGPFTNEELGGEALGPVRD